MMGKQEEGSNDGIARRDLLKLAGVAAVGIGGVALTGGPALAAGPRLAAGGGVEPTIVFFTLSADGITTTVFRDLIELRMAVERPDQKQSGPAFVAVLRFVVKLEPDIYAWFAAAQGGKRTAKRSAQIIGLDASATPLIKWNLTGARPTEIIASSTSTELLTQLTLVADSITPA